MRLSMYFAALLSVAIAPVVRADTLVFNLGSTNGSNYLTQSLGEAQGVVVSTTTTISGFAFYLANNTEDLKFFIDDSTGANVLYSGVEAVAASTYRWIESPPLSFQLVAGSEYYFGVVSDGSGLNLGYIFPVVSYSANGLTADVTGNGNTTSYANPTLTGKGAAEVGLQLFSPSATGVTPEPSSLLLLGTGLLGAFAAGKRRFA